MGVVSPGTDAGIFSIAVIQGGSSVAFSEQYIGLHIHLKDSTPSDCNPSLNQVHLIRNSVDNQGLL